ncbi:hypothetical protein Scep_007790 [Stephania cephalantha]|uniref:Uncharacterized protein n=1 Tax=Stephania cephalantha TaxID=152367 RepID=A0AAP0PLG1_9MAGN
MRAGTVGHARQVTRRTLSAHEVMRLGLGLSCAGKPEQYKWKGAWVGNLIDLSSLVKMPGGPNEDVDRATVIDGNVEALKPKSPTTKCGLNQDPALLALNADGQLQSPNDNSVGEANSISLTEDLEDVDHDSWLKMKEEMPYNNQYNIYIISQTLTTREIEGDPETELGYQDRQTEGEETKEVGTLEAREIKDPIQSLVDANNMNINLTYPVMETLEDRNILEEYRSRPGEQPRQRRRRLVSAADGEIGLAVQQRTSSAAEGDDGGRSGATTGRERSDRQRHGSSTCADSGSSDGSRAALGVGRGPAATPAAARLQPRGDDSGATR